MTGNVALVAENPVPLTVADFTISAAVPVEAIRTDCSCGEFTTTLPKLIEVALTLIAGVLVPDGESEIVNDFEIPFIVAVIVAVCAVVTLPILAVNPLLLAFKLTVTPLGTMTAGLLLLSAMYGCVVLMDVRNARQVSEPADV